MNSLLSLSQKAKRTLEICVKPYLKATVLKVRHIRHMFGEQDSSKIR